MKNLTNALTLMRIPFSIFLMPIFWFALLTISNDQMLVTDAFLTFIILHILVYPASNGYNSYFDKDEGSIGGLEKPPKVDKNLFYMVVAFDLLAIGLSFLLNWMFAIGITIYLLVSKAYSWDKIRLKKYPITSTVVVTIFQGAFTFLLIEVGLTDKIEFELTDFTLALVATLFLAGSYPITQIYQHQEDSKRGDKTISIMLGVNGTFLFSGVLFAFAATLMSLVFLEIERIDWIAIFALACLPILIFFSNWYLKSKKNPDLVNFSNTMTMNKLSSVCLSLAFLLMKLIS